MRNKTLTLIPVLAFAFSTVAIAQTAIDTDGDGMFSMVELTATYPDMTEETFTVIDTDADGSVSEVEMAAAVAAGTLPAMQ